MDPILPVPLLKLPGLKQPVDPRQIVRFEADVNYTYVWIAGTEKPLLLAQTLKAFELELQHFIRVSKVSLLNPRYIAGIQRCHNLCLSVRLVDGTIIPVSRRRATKTQHLIRHILLLPEPSMELSGGNTPEMMFQKNSQNVPIQ